MDTDNQLLERYANAGSESAFRELVQRRINLVHSAALRESHGNVPEAEDITQTVFTELARRASALTGHPALAGWLYTCVRQMAANFRRADIRRQRREQEAFTMNQSLGPDPTDSLWQEVRPVLDDVMHELDEGDRSAVVLRYFEGRNLKEIGLTLGLTESGARMRVERSLEKLRGLLSQRGVKSTASTLGAVLVSGAVMTAPSALASTVATSALTAAASGSATFTFAKVLSLAKTKTAAGAALVAALCAFLAWQSFRSRHAENPSGPGQITASASSSPAVNGAVVARSDPIPEVPAFTGSEAAPRMRLQLLDAQTSEPLPAAKLHLFYLLPDGRGKTIKRVTDGAGRLAVDIPQAPYKALNLFVAADGHVPMVTSWGFRREMPLEYTMRLEPGITIGGTVVDEAGRAVSGAKIKFDGPGNDMSLAENIQFGPDTPTETDAEGRWSCNMVPRSYTELGLVVTHSEYCETSATVHPGAPDAARFVVTLTRGASVAGMVQDSQGAPVNGATVREVRLNSEGEHSRTTDASGAFEFKHMKAGELVLAVQANGFAPAAQTIQLNQDSPDLRFTLGPGQLLHGRVVDEAGHPLTNVFVETTRRAIDKVKWSTNTDAEGRFEWKSAPAEPLLYSFLAEGFNRGYALSLQADGTEHEVKLTRFQPDKDTIQITGTAVDADTGNPLNEFKVMLGERTADGWGFPLSFFTTGKEGRFSVSLSAKSDHPGYQIQIENEGYVPAVSTNLLKKDGNQTLAFQLRLGSGPAGVVLLPGGDPAANASVLLCTSRGGVTLDGPAHVQSGINTTTYRTDTDAAGEFSLPAAISAQGVVVVHDQGYAEISPEDLASTVRVTLKPWGRVEGKLILDGRPVADATVIATSQACRYDDFGNRFPFVTIHLTAKTDSTGRFSFEKVPPGDCEIFQQQSFPGKPSSFYGSYGTSAVVTAGEVGQVLLGGGGRTITGKARLAGDTGKVAWQGVPVRLSLKFAHEPGARPRLSNYSSRDAFIQAMNNWDEMNRARKQFTTFCDSTGAFRLTDIPAGTYELAIRIQDSGRDSVAPHDITDPSPELSSVTREITVAEDQSKEPLDLGTLELVPQAKPTNASAQ
jgi:RNA polymerase sigma factor (sigma-70 family)